MRKSLDDAGRGVGGREGGGRTGQKTRKMQLKAF